MKKSVLLILTLLPCNLFSAVGSRALQYGRTATACLKSSVRPTNMPSLKPGNAPSKFFSTQGTSIGRISQPGGRSNMFSRSFSSNTPSIARPSWQGGSQSFNSNYLIPLAVVSGYSLTKPDQVAAEEYSPEDAARLIGFKNISDLNNVENILNFLDSDDYKNNEPLFSLVVANRLNDFWPALKGALEILQEDKGEKSLEKIRFLNQVILDVKDLNKIERAKTKIKPFKEALESLLTIESERPYGTKYLVGKVRKVSQIKDDSMLSRMIDAFNKDPQLKTYFLNQLSENTAYWGYAGGLADIEEQFKQALSIEEEQGKQVKQVQDSFHTLPKAYQELAEMIAQNPSAYSNVKAYAAYLPTLFNAVQEVEKIYSVPNTVPRKKVEKKNDLVQPVDVINAVRTEPSGVKQELMEVGQPEQRSSVESPFNVSEWLREKGRALRNALLTRHPSE